MQFRDRTLRQFLAPSATNFACLLVLLFAVWLPTPAAAQAKTAISHTPAAVRNGTATLLGQYPPEQKLRLVFALRPPHPQEEEQFLRDVQDRNSPLFHQFLTQEQWNERFAPSPENERAVIDWARSQGMTITHRYPNRTLVDAEATVATLQRAFGVNIDLYQLKDQSFFSNDRDPAVPAHLAPMLHSVLGLNNLDVFHSASFRRREGSYPDYASGPVYAVGEHHQGTGDRRKLDHVMAERAKGTGPYITMGGYDPADIYSSMAYDYRALANVGYCCNPLNNPGNSPPEASIAIVIWDDFAWSDVDGFLARFPYLGYNVQKYFVDGTPKPDAEGEATLDTEWAIAMSNSFGPPNTTAEVHVYEGANNHTQTLLDALNQALTDGHARVLSMSWGGPEADLDATDIEPFHGVFNQMVGQGWTLIAASGDNGAVTGCEDHLSLSYPGSDPDITSAGGTHLVSVVYNGGEFAWHGDSCSSDGGTGGGCSSYFRAPWYQGSTACGSGSRSAPDIALNADPDAPQYFFFQGQDYLAGGTSIVAPELAGFFAQENAYLLALGNICGAERNGSCAPLGMANPVFYMEGQTDSAPHYPFYDTLSGCNDNNITFQYNLPYYCAGAGLDQVTGWGSANMLQLAWNFNWYIAGDAGAPVTQMFGPPVNHWYTADQAIYFSVTDTSANGKPPIGVAGFTMAWDYDPGDPYSEASPGGGNPYYSGPAFPHFSSGYDTLGNANFPGWHIFYVRAWDNSGMSSLQTYGPLGYDSLPPATYAILSGTQQGGDYIGQVTVTLLAYDNLSGVAATYYSLNGGTWYTYAAPFMVTAPGNDTVQYYSVDNAGNVEHTESISFTILPVETKYTLSVSKTGRKTGNVVSLDNRIHCGQSCSAPYSQNAQVTLRALSSGSSRLAAWTGCDRVYGAFCKVRMTKNCSVTADFEKQ